MPLYVSDYLADTQHLSTVHHGAYLLLLMASWMRGGRLPSDDEQLASICRMDRKSWTKAKPVIAQFFDAQNGTWVQKRLSEEYEHARQISEKNKENGRKGGRPRKQEETEGLSEMKATVKPNETQRLSETKPSSKANGKPDETPLPSPLPKDKVKSIVGQRPDDAREVLKHLNEKAARAFEFVQPNLDLIMARLKQGASIEQCKRVIDRKVAEWGRDDAMSKYLRPATLFNKLKFAQYVGELCAPIPGEKNNQTSVCDYRGEPFDPSREPCAMAGAKRGSLYGGRPLCQHHQQALDAPLPKSAMPADVRTALAGLVAKVTQ